MLENIPIMFDNLFIPGLYSCLFPTHRPMIICPSTLFPEFKTLSIRTHTAVFV